MDLKLKVEQEGGGCNAKSAQFAEEGGQVLAEVQIQIQIQLKLQIQIQLKLQIQMQIKL